MESKTENPNGRRPIVELFTDGSCCHGNPGPGGWAFILRHSKSKIERVVSGGIGHTTNVRMEMIAVINGLRSLKRACRVTLFTDSKSVVSGITERVAEWKQFGWRKSVNSTKYVRDADLWMHLAKQCARHTVDAQWVKGHAGHAENERCDKLARQEAKKAIENLESSTQNDGAEAHALLADWVSATPPPPAAAPGPAAKLADSAASGGRNAALGVALNSSGSSLLPSPGTQGEGRVGAHFAVRKDPPPPSPGVPGEGTRASTAKKKSRPRRARPRARKPARGRTKAGGGRPCHCCTCPT